MDIHDLCDYVIVKVNEGEESLTNLKLQKLLYYCEAWHQAIHERELVQEDFEAWIHGPVNREIYDRFSPSKSLYSDITLEDIRQGFDDAKHLKQEDMDHIDFVLDVYAKFSGAQLERATHSEEPWIKAREGYRPTQRCEEIISKDLMRSFYQTRLVDAH